MSQYSGPLVLVVRCIVLYAAPLPVLNMRPQTLTAAKTPTELCWFNNRAVVQNLYFQGEFALSKRRHGARRRFSLAQIYAVGAN